nr:MAG TPA: restriction alleviation protein [Caudoviricetes sp.]
MTDLPKCPGCGMSPALRVRSRGLNWGSAEIRCSNGCSEWRVGFSFPPGGERKARRELEDNWRKLVEKT